MAAELPEFVPPMLAAIGRPFDSPDHLFEIKWDGTRALAFADGPGHRLLSRKKKDLVPGYPELEFLSELTPGLLLDGEIVVMRDGAPDFRGLLVREQARGEARIRNLMSSYPACYVVFDLLYRNYQSQMDLPLQERREQLHEVVAEVDNPRMVLSDGVVGEGVKYFEHVSAQALEGIMAKRLDSVYLPGKRSDAWQKIKAIKHLHCAILGFVPKGPKDLRSLIIAIEEDGVLTCVGKVGSGLTDRMRDKLYGLLTARLRDDPLIECGIAGKWVEPGLFCTVSYLERTGGGQLRAPVFLELISD